jgi:ribosomal protein S18 acetylase RimI-like enzyme
MSASKNERLLTCWRRQLACRFHRLACRQAYLPTKSACPCRAAEVLRRPSSFGRRPCDRNIAERTGRDARERFLPLLLLADESEHRVRSYLQRGDLYVFADDAERDAAGLVLVIADEHGAVELKAVAVAKHRQGQGLGLRMMRAVIDELRARGVRRVMVGTANAGIGQLAYYQKAGFRLLRIERDFFSPERGYPPHLEDNGIRLRDMVWMDQDL